MLALVLIIASAVLGTVTGFVLHQRRKSLPRYLLPVGGLFIVAGALALWYGTNSVAKEFAQRSWPTVEGTVTDSRVEGDRAFHPVVEYTYTVENAVYSGQSYLHQPNFGGKKKKEAVAVKMIADYPPGQAVNVYYDPKSPENSTLTPSVFWADYGKTAAGFTFMFLGIPVVFLTSRRRIS